MRKADLYYRNRYGHVVVCGWSDRGVYCERTFVGYTIREIRQKLSAEGVRGAWTFRKGDFSWSL